MKALENKSVIIFGCGYLGTRFAQLALRAEMSVTILTKNLETAERLFNDGADVLAAYLQDDSWHKLADAKYDYALNCVSASGGGLKGYRDSYVEGFQSINRWLENAEIGTLVYTSSTGVYEQSDGEQVDESATTGGNERADILIEAEHLLQSMQGHTRHFILRLCGIYGPGKHYLLDSLRSDENEIQGNREQLLNIIHVDDICAAIVKCMLAPEEIGSRVFNLSDNSPGSKTDVVQWLAAQLEKEMPSFTANKPEGRLIPARNRHIVSQKIRDELGWEPLYSDYRKGYSAILKDEA